MIVHLMKPIWKRKSRHLMLSLEILLAFLLVFAIVAAAGRYYQLARLPIGFEYQSVWSVGIQAPDATAGAGDPQLLDTLRRSLESLPAVQRVGFASFSPFDSATWQTEFQVADSGASLSSEVLEVSDEVFEVLGMQLLEGRWFSRQDDGAAEQAVVINRALAEQLAPGQSALGRVLMSEAGPGRSGQVALRVVGVFADFRNRGDYMVPGNFLFMRQSPQAPGIGLNAILLKLKPGTPRDFEVRLGEQLKQVRNDWGYRIAPLSELRKSLLAEQQAPLIVLAIIAAFLLLMVAFGLFGVLWQNTAQRIPEIGLRRAIGAHAGSIYWQIIVEQLLLSSLAMAAGFLLLVQLPLTRAFGDNLGWALFAGALAVSMLAIYLLSVLCALYPAWRASRLSPTEALRYQ